MQVDQTISEASIVAPQEANALKVLILDDQEADRVRIKRLLRKAGLDFTLYEAADIASFREQLDRGEMDLVFLDYYLDMETGLDALKLLIAHEDQAKALPIMVTSLDRVDVAVEAMRGGCADYLIKEQLSVEAIRKSVTSAFERSILISALSEAQSSRQALRVSVGRFARTCGPEIRSVLAGTLRHARAARQHAEGNPHFAANLSKLEGSCHDIFAFFDSLVALLENLEGKPETRDRLLAKT